MINKCLLFFIIFLTFNFAQENAAEDDFAKTHNLGKSKNTHILLLNSYHQGMPWFQNIKKGIRDVLRPQESNIVIHIEDMDTKRFNSQSYLENLKKVYKLKYNDFHFDLILSTDNNAFEFLKKYKQELFGKTPVIFAGLNNYENIRIDERDEYTGVLEVHSSKETLDLMLKFHPKIKKIYVLNDYLKTGLEVKKGIKNIINKFNYDIEFIFNKKQSVHDLQIELRKLGPDTMLFLGAYFTDKNSFSFTLDDFEKYILEHVNVPIYAQMKVHILNNVVGGVVVSGYNQGQVMGTLAKEVLEGKDLQDIPIVREGSNELILSYVELEKYKINKNVIPSNAVIINKPYSVYENYKYNIWATFCVFVILTVVIFLLINNINKRKKLETELEFVIHKFKSTFNNSTHLIGLLNLKGQILLSNQTSLDMINATHQDVYMKYFWDTPWWRDSPTDQERLQLGLQNALKHENTQFLTTHTDVQDQKMHFMDFSMKPYSNEKNEIVFIIVESTDVTMIKEVQHEVQELNEHLEKKVDNRTRELKEANDELQNTLMELKETQNYLIHAEKMASLGDLVAGVAHEINTPVGMSLTGITHFIDITNELNETYLKDEMSQDDFEKYLKYSLELSNSINSSLVKAANLIRSFKEVSVDQSSDAQRTFNMKDYLEEILLSLHHEIKRKKHNIHIDCEDDLVITSCPGSFSQILTNLIMNSFIHAFKGNIVGNIIIEVQRDNDILFLTYTDDGRGIAQENLSKIFDPFFTTNRQDGGSGLGLNIIFNIVNTTLKGKIECSSLENIGVEFKIIIPLGNEES